MREKRFGRKDDLTALKGLFSGLYAKKQWASQWHLFHLVKHWPDIAGEQVARLTAPAYFRQDVLWIFVENSAWMQHLQYAKLDLLQQVRLAVPELVITDLRWLLQPLVPTVPERTPTPPHPVPPEKEDAFRGMAASIADKECREALHRLWQAFASHEE